MESIWQQTSKIPQFTGLNGDLKTDVLIIGGGIAGLLCAYQLTKAGIDCILVEKDRICGGTTQNTTAKLTSQHGLIYHQLIQRFGKEIAGLYLEANQKALEIYRSLCHSIECDFKELDSFVYSKEDHRKIEDELMALESLGFNAEFSETPSLPFSTVGAVKFKNQAQFHPLRFAAGICRDLPIYENTKVQEIAPGKVITNAGTIKADKIIVATHFPIFNKHGSYFLKMYQQRSYVLAIRKAASLNGMYVDEAPSGMSFRCFDDYLLLGGGGHRTGKKSLGWLELEKFSQKYYPDAEIAFQWATQDCMTLDGIPYIGQYSRNTPNLYVATGFQKWGMSTAMVAAMILTDLVQGYPNPYSQVFSPSRSIMHPQLVINSIESVVNLLTPTAPRCPHLGCALKYNPSEHSWDCPCHGSRFTENGVLLDGPASADKRKDQ